MVMRARRGRGVVVKRRVVAGRRGMVGRGRREVRKDILLDGGGFWMAVEGGMVWRAFLSWGEADAVGGCGLVL